MLLPWQPLLVLRLGLPAGVGVEWVSEGLLGELRKEARRVFVLPHARVQEE